MLHRNSALGQRHAIHNWEYADEAAREAATGFVSSDLLKVAFQVDTGVYYSLTATTPTWVAIGGESTPPTAAAVTYDPTASGLISTDVQAAIDEIAGGSGGGGAWTLFAQDTMTALTNWTGVSGTWATGGGGTYIEQTGGSSSYDQLRFATAVPSIRKLIQVEIFIPSASGANKFAGVVGRWDGTETTSGNQLLAMVARVASSGDADTVRSGVSNTTNFDLSTVVTADAWHVLTVEYGAASTDISIDGTPVYSAILATTTGAKNRVGVVAFNNTRFRNFKVYLPTLP